MTKYFGFRSIIATSTGEVAQLTAINGHGTERDDIDTTTMDSSSDFRTFTAGLGDGGEVNLELMYDPVLASHKIIYHSLKDRVTKSWTVYHGSSTGDTDVFTGYVKSINREIAMDDVVAPVQWKNALQTQIGRLVAQRLLVALFDFSRKHRAPAPLAVVARDFE